jgi:molybdopterin biosynthesis enzyme
LSTFFVRSAGSGHFRPRKLIVSSVIPIGPGYAARDFIGLQTNKYFSGLTQYGGFVRNATMNADPASQQRIARLTPLADVLAAIAQIDPVTPCEVTVAQAHGRVLASDVSATRALPPLPVALRDGWAVASDTTRDAGPYAPLTLQPPPTRTDTFEPLPSGTDAVAPMDAVSMIGGVLQITAPVGPVEGVLPSGGDIEAGARLLRGGSRLRASDIAILSAAGVASVPIRQPRIRMVNTRPDDAALDAAATFVAQVASTSGATAQRVSDLDHALRGDDSDAIVVIGGTGAGRDDRSVIALARAGALTCHGIGLSPGETSAFGTTNGRPVLLMPGRIDAVLSCWLVLGRALVDRLNGAQPRDKAIKAVLARKITSTIGLAEVVPLRCNGDNVEPLASGYLSLQSLMRADGWLLVAAESEGYPAGTVIEMRPLP